MIACALALGASPAQAEPIALSYFELKSSEEGLLLSYSAQFELARAVDDALQKGLPLSFVAEAQVYRKRWYWADELVSSPSRTWRLTYLPLSRQYRVTFAGISRSHERLPDALAAMKSASQWRIAERNQLDDGSYYVEFTYHLDTTQLPRPVQLGIVGQAEWQLHVEKTQRVK